MPKNLSPLALVGLAGSIALLVVVGYFAGEALDQRWHTSPRYQTIGILGGLVLGLFEFFYALFRLRP